MAAASTRLDIRTRSGDGLHPANIARDLYQIAELVEVCFKAQLDASGRAALREMKAIGSLGPLLLPLVVFDRVGIGLSMGYVWRAGGRVVGNASLYRAGSHPWLGRGWFIANVAVHPDYRRRGIARAMMLKTLAQVRRWHGDWVSLQVEASNEGARRLYDDLGFEQFETLDQWENGGGYTEPPPPPLDWPVRLRGRDEVQAEIDLIYRRARTGAMAWTRPITPRDIHLSAGDGWAGMVEGRRADWVLPLDDGRLGGSLWIENLGWRRAQLSLFVDPLIEDAALRQVLLLKVLGTVGMAGRVMRLETTSGDEAIDAALLAAGFRKTRSLVQMRMVL